MPITAKPLLTSLPYYNVIGWDWGGGGAQNMNPSNSHPDGLRFGKQDRDGEWGQETLY